MFEGIATITVRPDPRGGLRATVRGETILGDDAALDFRADASGGLWERTEAGRWRRLVAGDQRGDGPVVSDPRALRRRLRRLLTAENA